MSGGVGEGVLGGISHKRDWAPLLWGIHWFEPVSIALYSRKSTVFTLRCEYSVRDWPGVVTIMGINKLKDRGSVGVEESWGKEEFPLIFSRCPQNYLCLLHLSAQLFFFFFTLHTDSHPLTQHGLNSNLIYLTVIFVLLLFFLSSSFRCPPLPGLWAMTGSWPSASRLSSSGTPTFLL